MNIHETCIKASRHRTCKSHEISMEVNLPRCTGRCGMWATKDLESGLCPPESLLPLPHALCTVDLAEVWWAEMEPGLDLAGVRQRDLYGEEENPFGEENPSSSPRQGLTPPSSAHGASGVLGDDRNPSSKPQTFFPWPQQRQEWMKGRADVSPEEFPSSDGRHWQRRHTGTVWAFAEHAAALPSVAVQPPPKLGTWSSWWTACPPDPGLVSSQLQPVCPSACVTSQRRNTKLNVHEAGARLFCTGTFKTWDCGTWTWCWTLLRALCAMWADWYTQVICCILLTHESMLVKGSCWFFIKQGKRQVIKWLQSTLTPLLHEQKLRNLCVNDL